MTGTVSLPTVTAAAVTVTQSVAQGTSTVNSLSAPILSSASSNPQKYHRFTLPEFNAMDPEVWFLTAEHIFGVNSVNSEAERFSYLLQSVPSADLVHVRDIMQSDTATKYSTAKNRLIGLHGETKDQKIQRLLNGLQINRNEKPSLILAKIKSVVSQGEDSDVIYGMWLRSLPEDTRRFCMASTGSLEEKATMADRLYTPQDAPNFQVSAIAQTSSQQVCAVDNATSMMNTLFNMLQNLQVEVASIKASKQSHNSNGNRYRNRNRSPFRYGRSRSRSRSKSPSAQPDIEDGKCWYHREFGNRARKCRVGCDKYAEFGSEN